ncbi:MAG: helix-turn-helix domain-containing protein [Clostridium sp.]
MYLGYILRRARSLKGYSLIELSLKTGVSKSALSNIENNKNNPTIDTLTKICDALDIETTSVISLNKDLEANLKPNGSKNIDGIIDDCIVNSSSSYNIASKEITNEITTAEDAVKFILSHPSVADYGNFDVNKLSDKDKINFANDLLDMIRMISPKYKK